MKTTIKLGEKVMVSDPCYGLNTWCQGVLENVLPGNYECEVEYKDEGVWGIRVAAIEVVHEDDGVCVFEAQDFEVGVDSGQAGIFDYDYYCQYHTDANDRKHVDDDWYDRMCDLTLEYKENPDYEPFDNNFNGLNTEEVLEKLRAWKKYNDNNKSRRYIERLTANTIDGLGFVSSSGYGDGGYTCYTGKNKDGKINAIRIEFISDEEQWDDEE
jgi:hypothetical protein